MQYEIHRNMINKTIRPTEGELEILTVLWDRGKATVREVHEEILKTKAAGYTTTLKLMQIMFDKNLVIRDSSAKTHIYEPVVTREETREIMVNRMVKNLFGGRPTDLVLQALGSKIPSKEELEQIEAIIQALKNK